ncbi:hypothetical protein [Fusobacterium ulcerans]|nr:hypothetical protein [Fusobacterium ulcerans]
MVFVVPMTSVNNIFLDRSEILKNSKNVLVNTTEKGVVREKLK